MTEMLAMHGASTFLCVGCPKVENSLQDSVSGTVYGCVDRKNRKKEYFSKHKSKLFCVHRGYGAWV